VKSLTVARDLHRRRARERTGLFAAEGVRCVEELLASQLRIRSAVIAPGLGETGRGAALESKLRSSAVAGGSTRPPTPSSLARPIQIPRRVSS
jgi:hypothetical protein